MSHPQTNISGTVLVVGIVSVFCFTVAGTVAVTIAVPDGANTGSLVTLLMGSLAPTIASIVLLAKFTALSGRVDDVAVNTEAISNGLMDAKIRAGLADVLDPALIDDDAHPQIAQDRARRELGNTQADERPSGGGGRVDGLA